MGGRAADAAFYPPDLIKEIVLGIKDTAIAEQTAADDRFETKSLINAISQSAGTLPAPAESAERTSSVKKTSGGVLPIGYRAENFKQRYLDECTGEVLPPDLDRDAIIDELDYFNQGVWKLETKDQMYKMKDFFFVRSRCIMCNKGDAAEPDVRSRLVSCEVNKTGEKNDQFHASTPPLEAKKFLPS